jgi:hypothetical protein
LFHILLRNSGKGDDLHLKYTDLKEYLGKKPYCFKKSKEKQREFDRKVATTEGRPIIFAYHDKDYENN